MSQYEFGDFDLGEAGGVLDELPACFFDPGFDEGDQDPAPHFAPFTRGQPTGHTPMRRLGPGGVLSPPLRERVLVYNEQYGSPISPRILKEAEGTDLLLAILGHIHDEDIADEAGDHAEDAQRQVYWAEGVSFDPDDPNLLVVNAIQAFNWHLKALKKIMCCLRAAGSILPCTLSLVPSK